ncbi:MAG: hypothetical protein ACRDLT_00590 [Solirubrobacteraceae bacterium]
MIGVVPSLCAADRQIVKLDTAQNATTRPSSVPCEQVGSFRVPLPPLTDAGIKPQTIIGR